MLQAIFATLFPSLLSCHFPSQLSSSPASYPPLPQPAILPLPHHYVHHACLLSRPTALYPHLLLPRQVINLLLHSIDRPAAPCGHGTSRDSIVHGIETGGVAIALTTRGGALVSLACLHQGKRYPFAPFLTWDWGLDNDGRRGRRRDLWLE